MTTNEKTSCLMMLDSMMIQIKNMSEIIRSMVIKDQEAFISIEEAIKVSGLSARKIRYLVDTGRVRTEKEPGRRKTYSYEDLKKYSRCE